MVKRVTGILLLLLATAGLAQAEEVPRPQASETQVQELTAQYTLLIRSGQTTKAIRSVGAQQQYR